MQSARRSVGRAAAFLLALIVCVPALHAANEKIRLHVDDYQIDATIAPVTHKLTARAKVKFTALEDLATATLELNNALRVTAVTDDKGQTLQAERVSQDNTVRVALPAGLPKGQSMSLTFDYEGTLSNADESPVEGLKLAYVGNDITYLLYASRWFPMSNYGINRFSATISITAPTDFEIIGSGKESSGKVSIAGGESEEPKSAAAKARRQLGNTRDVQAKKEAAPSGATHTVTYTWDKPSFPGTIIAGKFVKTTSSEGGLNLTVWTLDDKKKFAQEYASTATKELFFDITLFAPPISSTLNIVQLPDDTVPSAWAPEIAAIAGHNIGEKVNYRLLANTIAHQWWGVEVSPANKNDWWLNDGFARYTEALYLEHLVGTAGFEEAVKDMSVGALAYQSVPLSSIGTLDVFSPEFQSVVSDKGAMILHMLRFVLGDSKFNTAMRTFAQQNSMKPVTVDQFREACEKIYGNSLVWFFSQWVDSTSAPEFKNKYTIFRMGNGKGFRIVGEISQDLDLFHMPVEMKVDTDGKTENKTIDVVGTNSPYALETFGKPRRITIDPNDRVLKNSTDIQLRTAILRGQALVQQGDLAEALKQFQSALAINKNSSLGHYRIAEVFYLQRNYQAAANEYRDSLNGDGEPRWTEVWSYIQLGKIFDITGQRERAVNSYRQAIQTNDNTQGAMDDARKYLNKPYEREKTSAQQ
ncbi:peptidase M1, membrane alanine aminopeptidase [Candidatus Koribacter versatilis Ellin345]|uniref:Peptidase M1, membrane alanine aminopeptidase n=1 Tax=Koribacter versatilis (strain Ellin345) TaxID=204669 RepID=Q1INL3_KORVE|nr:M1 family aminopeptidase [Candidatus Koribacter versatilis]ABF41537.1 peptidase M1, membrane alanine aminopeptidase [Candidatus Koribacter versatilis Ellin345]